MSNDNSMSVYKFWQRNRILAQEPIISSVIFNECNVKYDYKNKRGSNVTIDELARVHVSLSDLSIEVYGDDFDSEKIHTGFNPIWGKFIYDEDANTLTIKNRASGGNLIDGDYIVILSF